MTTLEQLNLSQPLTDVYTAMETDLMMAIARQLTRDGEISATSEWRITKLAEAGALSKETVKIIASYTGIQSDLLTETIEASAYGIIDRLEPALQQVARDGLIGSVEHKAISDSTAKVVANFRAQAKTDLNLVNTVMQYKAKAAYTKLVNKIYDEANRQELLSTLGKHSLATAAGAVSRQEAVRNCIKEFSQKGIPAFVDEAGREWSPEAYINMDIRTTVNNTAHAAQDACCDKYNIDMFQISSHNGARPKCARDQGKLVSRSNRSGIAHDGNGNPIPFIPLSQTSYGQPDGIFGINCHHKKYPFIDGVNFQRYFPYDEEENAERYKELQKQRYLERRVRETSRQVDMLKETGDIEGAKEARRKLTAQRKAYREYSDSHGLAQHNDRLTVTRVREGDNVFADIHAKPLDNGGGSGIIQNTFTAAKTIQEAQEYAEKLGVKYADYSKFPLERANNINMALSTLPDDAVPLMVTDLQKYSKVTNAPLGRAQKNGYAVTASPYEINPSAVGSADARLEGSGETVIMVNTRNYKTLESLTESKREYNEMYSQHYGSRWHFNMSGNMTDFHECGHAYEKKHGLPTGFKADAEDWQRKTKLGLLKSDKEAWAEAYGAYYTHREDLPDNIRRYFDDGEWKTASGSKTLSFDEWRKKIETPLDNNSKSDIIKETEKDMSRYIGQPITKTDNQHVREWYYANVSDIPNQVDSNLPLVEQAKQAFALRNKYKHQARVAMADVETAEMLEKKRPAPTFDELVVSKKKRKGMTEDEAIEDILKTASKTNDDVNKEFGL